MKCIILPLVVLSLSCQAFAMDKRYQTSPALDSTSLSSTTISTNTNSVLADGNYNDSTIATTNNRGPDLQERETTDNDPRRWKTSERFGIEPLDGYKDFYLPTEPVTFSVAGASSSIEVTKENGFYVTAGLKNLTDNSGTIAITTYDSTNHVWRVNIPGTRDQSKKYELDVYLICGGGTADTPCASLYGNETMVTKKFPFEVHY